MSWPWNPAGTYLGLRWRDRVAVLLTNCCWQRVVQVSAKYVRHTQAIFLFVVLSNRVELCEAEPTPALALQPQRATVSESQILRIWKTLKTRISAFGLLPGTPPEPFSSPTLQKGKTFPCLSTWLEKTISAQKLQLKSSVSSRISCFPHHAAHAKPDLALHIVANIVYSIKSYWGFMENTLLWKQFCLYIIHFPVIFIPWVFYYWGIFAWK